MYSAQPLVAQKPLKWISSDCVATEAVKPERSHISMAETSLDVMGPFVFHTLQSPTPLVLYQEPCSLWLPGKEVKNTWKAKVSPSLA